MFSIKPRLKREWYVVFDITSRKRWYQWFLNPKFHHCYLMQLTPEGYFWTVVNPAWSNIELQTRLVSTFPTPRDYAGPEAVIVHWVTYIDPEKSCTQLNILQCTDICKRFIGVRKWAIFTPYQLFKHLMANNGRLCR